MSPFFFAFRTSVTIVGAVGSYQSLQRASLLDEAVWQKIMRGLSMRGYGEVVRELQDSYGSEHFREGSRQRLQTLEHARSKGTVFVRCSWMAHIFRNSS